MMSRVGGRVSSVVAIALLLAVGANGAQEQLWITNSGPRPDTRIEYTSKINTNFQYLWTNALATTNEMVAGWFLSNDGTNRFWAEVTAGSGSGDVTYAQLAGSNYVNRAQLAGSNYTTQAGIAGSNFLSTSISGQIAALTAKGLPESADHLVIEDSAATDAKKRITILSLEGVLESFLDLDQLQGSVTDGQIPSTLERKSHINTSNYVARTELNGSNYVARTELNGSNYVARAELNGSNYVVNTRALTVAGTANQITSSAGAQDLSSDRTWTLSLPSTVLFPGNIIYARGTNTDRHFSQTNFIFKELTALDTPPAGYVAMGPKTDGHWYQRDSGGTEIDLTLGSGGGEANVLANGGLTNAVRHPQAGGKSGVSLLLPTLQNGNGISIAGEYNGSGLPTNLVVSLSNTLNSLHLVNSTMNQASVTNALYRGWTNIAGASPVDLVAEGPGYAWLYMTNDTVLRGVPPAAGTLPFEMLLEVVNTNGTPYALTLSNFFGVAGNEQVLVGATNAFYRIVWTKTNLFIGSWHARNPIVDATIGAAGNSDTTNAYSKDDIHDYVFQNDSDFDGQPSAVEDGSIQVADLAGFTFAQLNTLVSDADLVSRAEVSGSNYVTFPFLAGSNYVNRTELNGSNYVARAELQGSNYVVTAANLGQATPVFASKSVQTLQFLTLTNSGTAIGFASTATSVVATVTRVGVWRTITIEAGAMRPSVTNGATISTNMSGGTDYITDDVYEFDDTTLQSVEWKMQMPQEWALGDLRWEAWGYSTNTIGTNIYGLKAKSVAANEDPSASWGSEAQHSAAGGAISTTAGRPFNTPTTAMTVGGTPAIGELVYFKLSRKPADVSDNLVGKSKLAKVVLHYFESVTEVSTP
jgi:hypothetical protein